MKQIITVYIFILFLQGQAYAQPVFRDGFIITHGHDTVSGQIDYRNSLGNSRQCFFKPAGSPVRTYSPDDLIAYRFTGSKYYISKEITQNDKPRKLFLEYLLDGVVDLYFYRDEAGDHYFIADKDGKMYELRNERKEVSVDDVMYYRYTKEYIGILKSIFRDHPEIAAKADNAELCHKSLIRLTSEYHNAVSPNLSCIVFEKSPAPVKVIFGPEIGVNGLSVSASNNFRGDLYYFRGSDFGFTIYPSIGFFLQVYFPGFNERLGIKYDISFSRMKLTTENTYVELVNRYTHLNDIRVTQNILSNDLLLKYDAPWGKKIHTTMHIGGFFNYLSSSDFYRKHELIVSDGTLYRTEEFLNSPFSSIDYGIITGFGLKTFIFHKKELFLDISYRRGFGLLSGLSTNTIQLSVGFQIGK